MPAGALLEKNLEHYMVVLLVMMMMEEMMWKFGFGYGPVVLCVLSLVACKRESKQKRGKRCEYTVCSTSTKPSISDRLTNPVWDVRRARTSICS